MAATKELMAAVNSPIIFEEQQISEVLRPESYAEDISNAVNSIKQNKICLKGHILAGRSTLHNKLSMQMQMNRDLDAFAHVAHMRRSWEFLEK